MEILGAVFDCDGLLVDTETSDYASWQAIYTEYDLTIKLEDWAKDVGAPGGGNFDWHGPLEVLVGPGYDREAIRVRRSALQAAAVGNLAPLPGVIALLDAFERAKIPCAVASNSKLAWVDRVLSPVGLIGRFAAIASAEEVEFGKPAPDVYLLAAKRLGVPPACCVAFEDSPHGLAAACAAGMRTVAVPTALTGHLDFSAADYIVRSLAEITIEDLCQDIERGK